MSQPEEPVPVDHGNVTNIALNVRGEEVKDTQPANITISLPPSDEGGLPSEEVTTLNHSSALHGSVQDGSLLSEEEMTADVEMDSMPSEEEAIYKTEDMTADAELDSMPSEEEMTPDAEDDSMPSVVATVNAEKEAQPNVIRGQPRGARPRLAT